MKNHRFLWLRNRTTDNRKCEKARNIKEKRTIEMFNTASKPPVAHLSSASADPTRFYKKKLKNPGNTWFPGFLSISKCLSGCQPFVGKSRRGFPQPQSPVSRRKPKPATSVVGREKAMDWAGESGPAFSRMERMISAFCSARATISTTSFSWAMVML